MRKYAKILSFSLVLIMLCAVLTACGGNKNNQDNQTTENTTETTDTTTGNDTTADDAATTDNTAADDTTDAAIGADNSDPIDDTTDNALATDDNVTNNADDTTKHFSRYGLACDSRRRTRPDFDPITTLASSLY